MEQPDRLEQLIKKEMPAEIITVPFLGEENGAYLTKREEEGWRYDHSFNAHAYLDNPARQDIRDLDVETWNEMCDRVEQIKSGGDWEVQVVINVKAPEDTNMYHREPVAYILKRKTAQRRAWDKAQGYNFAD